MEKKATKIVDLLVEDVRFPTSLELGQNLVPFSYISDSQVVSLESNWDHDITREFIFKYLET